MNESIKKHLEQHLKKIQRELVRVEGNPELYVSYALSEIHLKHQLENLEKLTAGGFKFVMRLQAGGSLEVNTEVESVLKKERIKKDAASFMYEPEYIKRLYKSQSVEIFNEQEAEALTLGWELLAYVGFNQKGQKEIFCIENLEIKLNPDVLWAKQLIKDLNQAYIKQSYLLPIWVQMEYEKVKERFIKDVQKVAEFASPLKVPDAIHANLLAIRDMFYNALSDTHNKHREEVWVQQKINALLFLNMLPSQSCFDEKIYRELQSECIETMINEDTENKASVKKMGPLKSL